MHRYYLQLLVALVSCVSLTQKAWCETTVDEEPSTPPEKGKFYQTHVFGERPRGCSVVYSADASAMSSTWKSSDFRLLNDVYTTGAYFENKIYSAESPTIHIPTVTYSDRLFVCLEEMFEVENFYDYVWIDVTTDGGNVWNRIYGKSGYTEGMVIDYLDVSFLSGKDAKFKISLKSDSSYTGAGWDIKKFDVLSYVRYAKNEERKSQLRSGDFEPVKKPYPGQNGGETGSEGGQSGTEGGQSGSEGGQSGSEGGESGTEGNPEITVNDVKIVNVNWESEKEGVISFSAIRKWKKEDGKDTVVFVDNISVDDIKVTIKNPKNNKYITLQNKGENKCLTFEKSISQIPVDIVLIVDYSASMSNYIANLKESLKNILEQIDSVYDVRFALLRYGYKDSGKIGLFRYEDLDYCHNRFWWTLNNRNQFFYNNTELKDLFDTDTPGNYEYAYQAIMHALALPKYRKNASKVFILLFNYDKTDPTIYEYYGKGTKYRYQNNIIPKDNVAKALEGTQLFAITDIYEKYKDEVDPQINYDYFEDLCNESGGLLVDGYSSGFSEIETGIGNNLKSQYFLRIHPECMNDFPLECGNEYNVSISISSSISDDINSTYIYSGGIEREQSTAEYDNTCIDSDKLKVKFTISGGCGDDLYGDAFVYYRYSDSTQKEDSVKANLISPKNENNTYVYEASVPVDFASSYIKYRIEVEHNKENTATKGLSNLIYPIPSEGSDGYWTVNICDPCNNIKLSSHILEEDNDLLSFDVYRENTNVEIFLCDTLGNKITSMKVDDVNVGNKEINLISFLSLNDLTVDNKKIKLSYTRPYILALKINGKVSYMYVYLGRKKEQN